MSAVNACVKVPFREGGEQGGTLSFEQPCVMRVGESETLHWDLAGRRAISQCWDAALKAVRLEGQSPSSQVAMARWRGEGRVCMKCEPGIMEIFSLRPCLAG